MPAFRFALLVLVSFGLAACAPRFIPAGPAVTAPAVDLAAESPALVMADGTRLPLRIWRPEGKPTAAILALHGFNDYSNAFDDAGTYWAKHSVVTYAYDQRGFGAGDDAGRWAGTETYIDDLRAAAALTRKAHPGIPLFILGESMGGAIVMTAMTSETPPVADGTILVAPAVWDRSHMPFYQTLPLWIAMRTVPWMQLSASGLDIMPSDNIEMLRRLSADPLVIKSTRVDAVGGLVDLMDAAFEAAPKLPGPSLILYGLRDEVVPEEPTMAMIDDLPKDAAYTIALYEKGYHMLLRDLQAERVMADVLAWISAPGRQDLPSGAARKASPKP